MSALGRLFRTTAFKISLAYLVLTSIGAALVLVSVGWNVKALIQEQVTQTVDADIVGLSEQYVEGGITRLVEIVDQRVKQPGAGLYLVTTHAGEPLVGNVPSLPVGVIDKTGVVETSYQVKGQQRRALARIFALSGGFRLLVGHDLTESDALAPILWRTLLSSLAWLTAIATIGGLVVARRVLQRVDRISAEARSITEGDLTGRLPMAGTDDELDRLVASFNAMLDRIAELMAGMKEVSDNVAHDLKTPLTRLRSRAEQALSLDRTADDLREALEKVIDDADGMIRIFNALLMIARAEAGAGRDGMAEFDAADVASDVGELYEPAAESQGVVLEGCIEPNLVVHGSRELIGQALANLVDNALKYGQPADGTVAKITISATRRGTAVEIAVADRGASLSAEDRLRIAERFVRLENSRTAPGTGLGLSLVAAVARLHNGEMTIEDSAPGLRIALVLPAVRTAALSPLAVPTRQPAAV